MKAEGIFVDYQNLPDNRIAKRITRKIAQNSDGGINDDVAMSMNIMLRKMYAKLKINSFYYND